MDNDAEDFPTRSRLWQGAILGTIAEAIWAAANPTEVGQWWNGPNYVVHTTAGDNAVVTFSAEGTVAAFFEHESPRNPFPSQGHRAYDWRPFLEGIPADLLAVAERESLPQMRDQYRGVWVPVITAAFWGKGELMAAAEPWPDVYRNGGHHLRIHILAFEQAVAEWRDYYELSPTQVMALRSLYEQRMTREGTVATVESWELAAMSEQGDDGLPRSRELLAAVGISLT